MATASKRKGRDRTRRAHRRRRFSLHIVRRLRRVRGITAVLFIGAGLLVGAVATFYLGKAWFERRPVASGPPVAVSWPEGLDASDAAALLADLGLTDYPQAMAIYLAATGALDCIKPGPHLLPRASPAELVAALCRSDDRPQAKLTIPEGFHRFAIADRVEELGIAQRDAFLHASADRELLYQLDIEPADLPEADTAEGFLFPATYELRVDSDPKDIVRRLVEESHRRWQRILDKHADGWEKLQAELDLGRRGVMTLASMVEKETGVAKERALIASVFLNRLQDPEFPHLQSDPTSIYGCLAMPERIAACEGFEGRATPAMNRDRDNLYSTYVTRGLPPGPIANPGDAAIEAVLAPAETQYLYFVANGKGEHVFTESYEAHLEAVKRLREARAP